MNEKMNANVLQDEELHHIAGGAGAAQTNTMKCPVHGGAVSQYDSIRCCGGNLTRYKCPKCARIYSLRQVKGEEDLTVDYTNPGSFGEK